MHRYLLSATQVSVILLLGGCGSLQLPYQGGTTANSGARPDQSLLEVWVPGSQRTVYDPPNKQINPLLNPRTPAPAFQEDADVGRQCSPNSLDAAMYEGTPPLVDRARFGEAMQDGRIAAEARHLWQFNQTRLQAQLKVVTGPRSRGGTEPVQPRPTGRIGAPQQAPKFYPAPRNPFSEQQQALQQNQAILAAQDENLRNKGVMYAARLADMYEQALTKFAARPAGSTTLAQLNSFEAFRANQIQLCLAARGLPDAQAQAVIARQTAKYVPIAQSVVSASRSTVMQAVNAASTSQNLQWAWTGQFSTPWLQNLAAKDEVLSKAISARSQTLLAQEAREREVAARRASEEAARQAALVRKKYLENAAKGVVPSTNEVAILATTYWMANTSEFTGQGRLGELVRTGDNSFEDYQNNWLFGRVRIGWARVAVEDIRCQPSKQKLACNVRINQKIGRFDMVLGPRTERDATSNETVDFQWTAAGLESPTLKKAMGLVYTTTIARGGQSGSSSNSSDNGNERAEFNNNLDQFRDTQRREAAEANRPYMGTSGQNLQREYGIQR